MANPSDFKLEFVYKNQRYGNALKAFGDLSQDLGKPLLDLNPAAAEEIRKVLEGVRQAMIQRHSTPWQPWTTLPTGDRRGKLARRSGRTMTSIEVESSSSRGGARGVVRGPFYLRVHEYGATIRPRRATYLAIPLPAALDRRGVPLKPRPRAWRNTFVAQSKKGNLLIFQRRGKNIVPLYALRKEVRIPPRLGLGATMDKATEVFIDRLFDRVLGDLRGQLQAA